MRLTKHSLRLYEGDLQRLGAKYPLAGASLALRELLHRYLNKVDQEPPSNLILPEENFGEVDEKEFQDVVQG